MELASFIVSVVSAIAMITLTVVTIISHRQEMRKVRTDGEQLVNEAVKAQQEDLMSRF